MFKKKRNKEGSLGLVLECFLMLCLLVAMLAYLYASFKFLATGTFL